MELSGRVRQLDKTILVGDYVLQVPPLGGHRTVEQAESFAQKRGRDLKVDFVDEAELEKPPAQHRSADKPDVAIPRCELRFDQRFQIARVELDGLARRWPFPARHDNHGSVAV